MKQVPFVSGLFKKLARGAGVTIKLDPGYGYAGQITTKSGRKHYFRGTRLDINTLGATEISADKDYAAYFMRSMGYPAPTGEAFFSAAWAKAIGSKRTEAAALRYAKKLGFPVIVKPNSKSRGVGVAKVSTFAEFHRAFRSAAKQDSVILVQKPILGKDYRIVVLDGRVISAYERKPLTVKGDGKTNIAGLLKNLQKRFIREGRDTVLDAKDWRIQSRLKRSGLTLRSVPDKGVAVQLLDNANLSSGGEPLDVSEALHPGFRKLAIDVTRNMGLRLCGVDLMVDADVSHAPKTGTYVVLEINSAPGLDHYASHGKKQEKIVENLYLELLRSMSK